MSSQNEVSESQNHSIEHGRQTSQDNIERESIPQYEKSRLALFLLFVNTILIIVYGCVENTEALINIGLSLLGVLLAPIVRCFCNVVEEFFQFRRRYRRNILNLFKQCFSGISWKPVVAFALLDVMFCLLAKILTKSSFDLEDAILISSGISVGPLVVYLLKLNAQSDVDISRLLEGKWLHPAYILAWNYYINYLEKALPVFSRSFSSRILPMQNQVLNEHSVRDAQPEIELSLNKLILLFSDNYKKELGVVDLDNHIRKITDICEAGYKFPVYSVNDNGNAYKFVILFAEEPLESIKRIPDFERKKLIHSELLYRNLASRILSNDHFCRDKCIPILITETHSLDNGGLVKQIMNVLQRKGCKPESNARDDTESSTPAMSTEQPHTEEPDDSQVPSLPRETSNSQQEVDIDHAESYESSDKAITRADTEPHNPLMTTTEQPQEPDNTLVPSLAVRTYLAMPMVPPPPQVRMRKYKKIGDDSAMHNLKTSSSILKREIAFMKQLQQWLGEKCKWNLCYRASRNGWKPKIFTDIVTIKDRRLF